MAIKIETAFPGRSNSGTPAYPNGSFRNRSSETAEDGTYLRADWANDIFGFLSRLLDEASITPDGDPDTVLDSQYFTALESVIQAVVDSGDIQEEIRDVMGATLVAGTNVTIDVDDPGNTITINAVQRTDEDIRDTAYAGLVAGEGIEIDVNDPADTATISASLSAARWSHTLADGSNDQPYTGNIWNPVVLNTEDFDPDGLGVRSGNQVTFPAGLYLMTGTNSAHEDSSGTTQWRTRFYDITHSVPLLQGSTGHNSGGGSGSGGNEVNGPILLTEPTAIEMQVWPNASLSGTGDVSTGDPEVFATFTAVKLA